MSRGQRLSPGRHQHLEAWIWKRAEGEAEGKSQLLGRGSRSPGRRVSKDKSRDFPYGQGLKICAGTWVQSLVWEDSAYSGQPAGAPYQEAPTGCKEGSRAQRRPSTAKLNK